MLREFLLQQFRVASRMPIAIGQVHLLGVMAVSLTTEIMMHAVAMVGGRAIKNTMRGAGDS